MALTLPVLNTTALTESGEDPVVTKYYFHAGKRVAMDRGCPPGRTAWQFGYATLQVHSHARHFAYGEERWR